MRVLFLGRGRLGYLTLQKILDRGHDVPVIVSTEHTENVEMSARHFERLAKERGIPYYFTKDIHAPLFVDLFREAGADVAVAVLWIRVIHSEVIGTTRHGFLNVHAGDLPRYRGNAVMNWAILAGEPRIGLCVHFMEPGRLDSGDVVIQRYIDLSPRSTIGEVVEQVHVLGPNMVAEALDRIAAGTVEPRPQDHGKALRCYPRNPSDGEICWERGVEEIDRLVRSVSDPFPGAFTFINGKRLFVWTAHPEAPPPEFLGLPGQVADLCEDGSVRVLTGHGGMLVLKTVQLEGQGRVRPLEVIRSARVRLGMNHSERIVELERRLEALEKEMHALKPPVPWKPDRV